MAIAVRPALLSDVSSNVFGQEECLTEPTCDQLWVELVSFVWCTVCPDSAAILFQDRSAQECKVGGRFDRYRVRAAVHVRRQCALPRLSGRRSVEPNVGPCPDQLLPHAASSGNDVPIR